MQLQAFFHIFNNYNIVSCHYEFFLLCFILTFQWKVKKNPSEPQKIIILTLISVIVIVLNSILL